MVALYFMILKEFEITAEDLVIPCLLIVILASMLCMQSCDTKTTDLQRQLWIATNTITKG